VKLNLTLTAERHKPSRYGVGYGAETETYDHAKVENVEGPPQFLANTLRALADAIDPSLREAAR
jgi:hypothetical protein